jgi:hypothetical protein
MLACGTGEYMYNPTDIICIYCGFETLCKFDIWGKRAGKPLINLEAYEMELLGVVPI